MNLKEKTIYKVDFDTQNNKEIVGEHHSFLFSFEKNNFNKKIILIANKEKDDFLKTTTFEFDFKLNRLPFNNIYISTASKMNAVNL